MITSQGPMFFHQVFSMLYFTFVKCYLNCIHTQQSVINTHHHRLTWHEAVDDYFATRLWMIPVLHTSAPAQHQNHQKKLPSRARWNGIYIIENCRHAPAGNDTIGYYRRIQCYFFMSNNKRHCH